MPRRGKVTSRRNHQRTPYPPKHPLNLPVGGPWQYLETDWGGLAKEWRDLRYKNGDVITLALGKSFGH